MEGKKGVLTFDPDLIPRGDYVHALVTDKIFKSFQLSIEWNISEGGNSGIFWGVQEDENLSTIKSSNIEGIVIESFSNINETTLEVITKLKLRGIKVITTLTWFEKELNRSPTNLIYDK